LICEDGAVPCRRGLARWDRAEDTALELPFERAGSDLRLTGETVSGTLARTDAGIEMALKVARLEPLNALLPEMLGLRALEGGVRVRGDLRLAAEGPESIALELGLSGLGFDTASGQHAAAGVGLELDLAFALATRELDLALTWTAGEILSGPLYLPPPEAPLALTVRARGDADGCSWLIERARAEQAGVVEAAGDGSLRVCDSPGLERITLALSRLDLESAWDGALGSVASTYGWGDLSPSGRLVGRVALSADGAIDAQVRLLEAALKDARGRLGVEGLNAALVWRSDTAEFDARAQWSGAQLFRIPLGASALGLVSATGSGGTPDLRLS
ncbi:MAG: hypothetical protein ACPGJE_02245, partial [Wenzhouxiangellaceae bacterium]